MPRHSHGPASLEATKRGGVQKNADGGVMQKRTRPHWQPLDREPEGARDNQQWLVGAMAIIAPRAMGENHGRNERGLGAD